MAKIIYKEGCEGQNKLSCIEGIEIDLFNGQKALIYPKYAEKPMLGQEQISVWEARQETEIEALKAEDINEKTKILVKIGSRAALWASQFRADSHKAFFCLPSLIAALEIQHQKKEIDALAETIEGADLLGDFTSYVWSCSRCSVTLCWYAIGYSGYANVCYPEESRLAVPTILYK